MTGEAAASMRTRFYAPCSGSCVADRMVRDDAMPGRVSRNASGLHALFCVVSDRKRKTPREVAAWRLYVWRAALPVGKLCCRTPSFCSLVGSIGFEPTTPTMSRWCSNQLSYEPKKPRIIERVLGQHKPLRENFLKGRVWRRAIDVACRCGDAEASSVRITAKRVDVLWCYPHCPLDNRPGSLWIHSGTIEDMSARL